MMQKRGTMIKYKNIEAEEAEDFWNFLAALDITLDDGRIAGYLRAEPGKCNRIRHTPFFQGWINGPKKIRFTGWNYPLNVQMKRQDICMKEAAFPSKESEKVLCM